MGFSDYQPPANVAHRSAASDAFGRLAWPDINVEAWPADHDEALRFLIWYVTRLERTIDELGAWSTFRRTIESGRKS